MAEILVKFDEAIVGEDGERYFAQAAAREREDGLWEGWLEFLPVSGDGEAVASERETTQPNRVNLKYWAEGLTRVYLEGALQRATTLARTPDVENVSSTSETARFQSPPRRQSAPEQSTAGRPERVGAQHPILDPYSVYSQGEDILRSELGALSRSHVETIVSTYGFSPKGSAADLSSASEQSLINAIVEGVRGGEPPRPAA